MEEEKDFMLFIAHRRGIGNISILFINLILEFFIRNQEEKKNCFYNFE